MSLSTALPKKRMNNYRLQYWLYACLNKQFGANVQLSRDPLHSRYEVNRHAFYVQAKAHTVADIKKYIESVLLKAGFQRESRQALCKSIRQDQGLEQTYVTIEDTMEPGKLYISGRVYRR